MEEPSVPTVLPPSLYRFFWDVQAEKVNPSTHPQYVINRLLDKGDLGAVKWVLWNFSKKTVIDSLRHGPAVDPPTASFWSSYLRISRKDIATNNDYRRKSDLILWPFGDLN